MIKVWTLPVPSTALLDHPVFEIRPRHVVVLRLSYELDDEGTPHAIELNFGGVEALRITHYHAQDSSMLQAYDCLMEQGTSPWLLEVRKNLSTNHGDTEGLAHYMINFDDGPCYEVLSRSWHVEDVENQVQRRD